MHFKVELVSEKKIECVMPFGSYYIGDISYILEKELFDILMDYRRQNKEGLFKVYENWMDEDDDDDFYYLWFTSTIGGNGEYRDKDQTHVFNVQSGTIGIVPFILVEDFNDDYEEFMFNFNDDINIYYVSGIIQISNADDGVLIDTT